MCLPIFGSCCHSAKVIPFICSAEITRVVTFVLNWKHVQDACSGRRNLSLKRVRKLQFDGQFHSCTLPNDRAGISVRAFSTPGMFTRVSRHDCLMFRRSASARTNCAATLDFLEAILVTQLTVGELSLNKAMCLCAKSSATPSRQSHKKSNPAISRLEFVIRSRGFSNVTKSFVMSAGHCKQNTVGGTGNNSPKITPPTP
jgi:hypothetical protein